MWCFEDSAAAMKFLLIASDIHHDDSVFEKLCGIASSPDCLGFLYAGDLDYENYFILTALRNRNFVFLPVLGNCDNKYSAIDAGIGDIPLYRTCTYFSKHIFLTHGHLYSDPESAGLKNSDFDICINGHSHIGSLSSAGSLTYLNPGSAARPRGASRKSFAKFFEDGKLSFFYL